MPGSKVCSQAASGDEVRSYIMDMLEQLAQMAIKIGDEELAIVLREVVPDRISETDDLPLQKKT